MYIIIRIIIILVLYVVFFIFKNKEESLFSPKIALNTYFRQKYVVRKRFEHESLYDRQNGILFLKYR